MITPIIFLQTEVPPPDTQIKYGRCHETWKWICSKFMDWWFLFQLKLTYHSINWCWLAIDVLLLERLDVDLSECCYFGVLRFHVVWRVRTGNKNSGGLEGSLAHILVWICFSEINLLSAGKCWQITPDKTPLISSLRWTLEVLNVWSLLTLRNVWREDAVCTFCVCKLGSSRNYVTAEHRVRYDFLYKQGALWKLRRGQSGWLRSIFFHYYEENVLDFK